MRRAVLWAGALCVALLGLIVQVMIHWSAWQAEHCGVPPVPHTTAARPSRFRVLVFTKHAGYSHRSIPAGIVAIRTLGVRHGFSVLATDDAGLLADPVLPTFAAVIFLNTTGTILTDEQRAALEHYVHAGGGFVGIHSAMDTESRWAWYHRLLGGDFLGHPPIQRARLIVSPAAAKLNPSLPKAWERTDEWYNYRAAPESVTVLVSVDETSYRGGTMGRTHPVTWYHDFEGGRAWYTAMGHGTCSYAERAFLEQILSGIRYAANVP